MGPVGGEVTELKAPELGLTLLENSSRGIRSPFLPSARVSTHCLEDTAVRRRLGNSMQPSTGAELTST